MSGPALLQKNGAFNTTPGVSTLTAQFASGTVPAGTLLVAGVGWPSDTGGATVTDDTNAGGAATWQPVPVDGSGDLFLFASALGYSTAIFWTLSNVAGMPTVSFTPPFAENTFLRLGIHAYSGVGALDQYTSAVSSVNGTAASTPNVTTLYANELGFGWPIFNAGTPSAGVGWTLRETLNSQITEDIVLSSAGSYAGAASTDTSTAWMMQFATFYLPTPVNLGAVGISRSLATVTPFVVSDPQQVIIVTPVTALAFTDPTSGVSVSISRPDGSALGAGESLGCNQWGISGSTPYFNTAGAPIDQLAVLSLDANNNAYLTPALDAREAPLGARLARHDAMLPEVAPPELNVGRSDRHAALQRRRDWTPRRQGRPPAVPPTARRTGSSPSDGWQARHATVEVPVAPVNVGRAARHAAMRRRG